MILLQCFLYWHISYCLSIYNNPRSPTSYQLSQESQIFSRIWLIIKNMSTLSSIFLFLHEAKTLQQFYWFAYTRKSLWLRYNCRKFERIFVVTFKNAGATKIGYIRNVQKISPGNVRHKNYKSRLKM